MNRSAVFYKDPAGGRLLFNAAASDHLSLSQAEAFSEFLVRDKFGKIPGGRFAYLPWVGKRFSSFKNRLFLIGESYYWDEKVGNENYAYDQYGQALIAERMLGERNANYTKLFKAINPYGGYSQETRIKLCSSLVYFNLIQRCLKGRRAKEEADFINGWASFFKAAAILKPTLCVFNGVAARAYLERGIAEAKKELKLSVSMAVENMLLPATGINGCGALRPVRLLINNAHSLQILWLKHSSAGFSPKQWRENYLMRSNDFREWASEIVRE